MHDGMMDDRCLVLFESPHAGEFFVALPAVTRGRGQRNDHPRRMYSFVVKVVGESILSAEVLVALTAEELRDGCAGAAF